MLFKYNIFKYIFYIFVVALILLSIFLIYKDKKNNNTKLISNNNEIKIIKEVNIGIAEFDTLNPLLTKNLDIQYIDKLIFRSLLKINKDFRIENDLAEECSKINDKVYIIKLKQNIKWHNNDEFISNDVKFTIENLKKIESIYSDNVKNIEKVEIIDKYTLKIYLNSEIDFFEYMLNFPILNQNTYIENSLKSKTEIIIGTGEYKIIEISENKIIIQNENNKINIRIYKEIKDLYSAFSKEEIDVINTSNIKYEDYTGIIGINKQVATGREFDYLAINNQNRLLQNEYIRKAINYFIDKKRIINSVYKNKYAVGNFPLNPENYLYNEEIIEGYNINKGEELLKLNGWNLKNNIWQKKGEKLEFNLIVNASNKIRCEVAKEIKKELEISGIVINIIQISEYNYNQKIKYKNYDLLLIGNIIGISPLISTYFDDKNIFNYENEEITNILKEIKNIKDENILKEKYFKIQEIYNKEIPFISLYFNNNYVLYNSKIKGDFSHNWYNLYYNINSWYITK